MVINIYILHRPDIYGEKMKNKLTCIFIISLVVFSIFTLPCINAKNLTSNFETISPDNNPPEPPTITGQTNGKAGVVYEYTFVSIDPEGDNVSYYIDWGDKCGGFWIDPHPSGVSAKANHGFVFEGTYTINALAVDSYGAESSWGQLEVTMPIIYNVFDNWFCFFIQHSIFNFIVNSFLLQFY